MTDRSEERNAGRQEMNDCMSECRAILLLESHPMAGLIVCQWVAFEWHPRILGRSWREGMASRLQTDIHTSTHTVIQTYMVQTYMQTVGPETSFKPGLGAMEIACNAMEIAAKQTLCEEASLEDRP